MEVKNSICSASKIPIVRTTKVTAVKAPSIVSLKRFTWYFLIIGSQIFDFLSKIFFLENAILARFSTLQARVSHFFANWDTCTKYGIFYQKEKSLFLTFYFISYTAMNKRSPNVLRHPVVLHAHRFFTPRYNFISCPFSQRRLLWRSTRSWKNSIAPSSVVGRSQIPNIYSF